MSRRRVDDYFKVGCGDTIREKDGRHDYTVRAVVSNLILCDSVDNGWKAEFLIGDIDVVERRRRQY